MGMINRLGGFSFVGELQGRGRHLSGRIYDPIHWGHCLPGSSSLVINRHVMRRGS